VANGHGMESFCGTTDVDPDHHLFAHWVSFIILNTQEAGRFSPAV
jgi:hypothetical protein